MYKPAMDFADIRDEIKAVWDIRETDQRCLESYYELAAAIIASAAKQRDKKFFQSDWFRMLMQDNTIDGIAVYNQILKNFDKYGGAFVPDSYSFKFKKGGFEDDI